MSMDELFGTPADNGRIFARFMDRQLKLREHIFGKEKDKPENLHGVGSEGVSKHHVGRKKAPALRKW